MTLVLLAAWLPWGWNDSVASAQRGPHAVRAEGGLGLSFREGDERDDLGGGFGVGYEYRFVPFLGVEARFEGYFFPYDTTTFQGSGVATYYAGALGLRGHLAPGWEKGDLWLGAAGAFVRTGDLSRAGLEAGLGADFFVSKTVGIGPFVRYAHIFQPDDAAEGPSDGRLLLIGAALTWAPERRPDDDEPEDEVQGADDAARGAEPSHEPAPRDDDGTSDVATSSGAPADDGAPTDEPGADDAPVPSRIDATIRFDFQSSDISPESESELRRVVEILRAEPRIRRVEVIGHADHLGESHHNHRISEERARVVARWLRAHGAGHVRFTVRGAGDTQPVVGGDTPEALAPNRRVELVVVED